MSNKTTSKSKKTTTVNNPASSPVPAANFGWFVGKYGEIRNVVSKPFTTADLKAGRI